MSAYLCPICGYDKLDEPAYQGLSGSLEMCPSCGFQYGVDDHDRDITHEQWREQWIQNAMPWFSQGVPTPVDWNPRQQLQNIGIFLT